jgi:hypothetical protein
VVLADKVLVRGECAKAFHPGKCLA